MRLQGILCNKDLPPPITNKHLWATKSMKWYCVSDNYITLAWRTSETENTCSRAYKSLAWTLRHLQLPQKTYSNYTISLCVHFQKEHFKLGNHPHFWTTPQLVMGTGNPWILLDVPVPIPSKNPYLLNPSEKSVSWDRLAKGPNNCIQWNWPTSIRNGNSPEFTCMFT